MSKKRQIADRKKDDWKMPEPIFRVSDGTTLGSIKTETAAAKKKSASNIKNIKNQPGEEKSAEIKIRQSGIFFFVGAIFLLAVLLGIYFLFVYKFAL